MSNWAQGIAEMDAALMAEFAIGAVLHLPEGDRPVQGIFDNPHSLSRIESGGHVADSSPEIYLQDADAVGVEQRQTITVAGRTWFITKPPEPDGTGLTKLILGHYHESQQSKPAIRY